MAGAQQENPERRGDCTVFLIDDDRAMVSSTAQWLSLSGLKIRSFADPLMAIQAISRGMAAVIVSDIRMPGMDGLELLKQVKKRDRDLPVILITGHGDVPLAVEAMKAGASEFLTKPFSPEALLAQVEKEIDGRLAQLAADGARAGQMAKSSSISADPDSEQVKAAQGKLTDRIGEYERRIIQESLKRHGGSIAKVMAELDLPRRTLNAKMQKYGLSRK